MGVLDRWGNRKTEWCPGASAEAIDPRWNPYIPGEYFCPACGHSVKIPKRGHKVGLVPAHKRIVGTHAPMES